MPGFVEVRVGHCPTHYNPGTGDRRPAPTDGFQIRSPSSRACAPSDSQIASSHGEVTESDDVRIYFELESVWSDNIASVVMTRWLLNGEFLRVVDPYDGDMAFNHFLTRVDSSIDEGGCLYVSFVENPCEYGAMLAAYVDKLAEAWHKEPRRARLISGIRRNAGYQPRESSIASSHGSITESDDVPRSPFFWIDDWGEHDDPPRVYHRAPKGFMFVPKTRSASSLTVANQEPCAGAPVGCDDDMLSINFYADGSSGRDEVVDWYSDSDLVRFGSLDYESVNNVTLSTLQLCLVAPYWEEMFKEYCLPRKYGGVIFSVFETLAHMYTAGRKLGYLTVLRRRVPAFIMHIAIHKLNRLERTAMHALFNFVVCYIVRKRGMSGMLPIQGRGGPNQNAQRRAHQNQNFQNGGGGARGPPPGAVGAPNVAPPQRPVANQHLKEDVERRRLEIEQRALESEQRTQPSEIEHSERKKRLTARPWMDQNVEDVDIYHRSYSLPGLLSGRHRVIVPFSASSFEVTAHSLGYVTKETVRLCTRKVQLLMDKVSSLTVPPARLWPAVEFWRLDLGIDDQRYTTFVTQRTIINRHILTQQIGFVANILGEDCLNAKAQLSITGGASDGIQSTHLLSSTMYLMEGLRGLTVSPESLLGTSRSTLLKVESSAIGVFRQIDEYIAQSLGRQPNTRLTRTLSTLTIIGSLCLGYSMTKLALLFTVRASRGLLIRALSRVGARVYVMLRSARHRACLAWRSWSGIFMNHIQSVEFASTLRRIWLRMEPFMQERTTRLITLEGRPVLRSS